MAGINMGSMNSADAMSPELYPDIVQSVPFMTELFGVEVRLARDERRMPVSEYVSEELRSPWWSAVAQRRSRRWDGSRGCSARRTTNAAERA